MKKTFFTLPVLALALGVAAAQTMPGTTGAAQPGTTTTQTTTPTATTRQPPFRHESGNHSVTRHSTVARHPAFTRDYANTGRDTEHGHAGYAAERHDQYHGHNQHCRQYSRRSSINNESKRKYASGRGSDAGHQQHDYDQHGHESVSCGHDSVHFGGRQHFGIGHHS